MTSETKKDFTLRITQANKSGLIVILYEMYLAYLEDAVAAGKDRQGFREAIRKGRGCINELMDSLNFDYEIAYHLLQLYIYINKEMAVAEVHGDIDRLDGCRRIISSLLEAYRQVSAQDTSAPLMENAQAVYAGLTYGKGELTENLAHQGNRGFLV